MLDTVKLAEDSDAVVLRLYEPHGGRGSARVTPAFEFGAVHRANLLEEPLERVALTDGAIELHFRPFEIVTLVVR